MNLSESHSKKGIILPVIFPNLTYLSIEMAGITLDDLEIFIVETKCNLKVLHIDSISEDKDYLDADRWKELIINYLPELEEFYLECRQTFEPESGYLTDFQPPDQSNSLFGNE